MLPETAPTTGFRRPAMLMARRAGRNYMVRADERSWLLSEKDAGPALAVLIDPRLKKSAAGVC